MKRVLVTGAGGFIGRQSLAPLARRGFEVHAVGRSGGYRDGVTWHRADLMDDAGRRRLMTEVAPSHLLHLAWDTSPGSFWELPDNLDWVGASLSLLRLFAEQGGQRWVGAGSCAEYDWASRDAAQGGLSETASPAVPHTLYGEAKLAVRRLSASYARTMGLSAAWGILFLSYGAFEKPERLVSGLIRSLLSGAAVPTTAGLQMRDFLDTRDIGAALAALLDSDVRGPVNVASGQGVRVVDIVRMIGGLTGRPDLLRIGALPMRANDPPRLVADIARLRDEVGFHPARSLEQGLADAVAWWCEELAGAGLAETV